MASAFEMQGTLRLRMDMGDVRAIQTQLSRIKLPDFSSAGSVQAAVNAARDLGARFGESATAATQAKTAVSSFAASSVPELRKVASAARRTAEAMGAVATAAANANRAGAAVSVPALPRTTAQAVALKAAMTGVGSAARTGFAAFERAARSGLSNVVEYQREVVRLRQVSEETGGELSRVGAEVDRLSRKYGTSATSLMKQAVDLKAAGLSIRDVGLSLEAVAKATLAPSFGDSRNATDALVTSMAVFGRTGKDAERTLGSLNALSNAYAATAEDLVGGLRRGGGAWRAAGGDLNEFAAAMTVAKAKTQETAATVGTSVKAISARLMRPATLANLGELGVDLRRSPGEAAAMGDRGAAGTFVGPHEALSRVAAAVSGLRPGDTRRAQIVEQVGGLHHFSRVEALLSNWGEVEKAAVVGKAGESSLDTAAAQGLDSFAAKLDRVREAWLSTTRSVADARGFGGLVDTFETGATAAAKLAGALGPLVPLVGALGAARLAGAYLPTGATVGSALTGRRLTGGAALAAGAFAPDLLAAHFGRPGQAGAAPGSETAAGIGGALSGAATGAAVGMMFGPWGAAVGGAVGALAGFTTSLRDAAEAVRSAKLDKELVGLAAAVDSMAKGGAPGDPAEAGRGVSRSRALVAEQAMATAGGRDAEALSAAYRGEYRKTFGPNLAGYVAALNAEAERAGRRAPGADPAALAKGFAESNRELIRVVADLSGRTSTDAAGDFARVIRAGQTSARARDRADRAEDDATRTVTAFGRLGDAADRATRGLSTLDARAAALGMGAEQPRPSVPDLSDPGVARRALAPLGADEAPLMSALRVVEDLERALPAALARAAAANPLDGEGFAERVRDVLGQGGSAEHRRAVDLVAGGLGRRDLSELMRATAADVSGLAREALSGYAEPARRAAGAVGRAGAEATTRTVDLLNLGSARGQAAGALEDGLAGIRLAQLRLPFQLRQQDPADRLTAAQLGAPFAEGQRRLAGGLAFDPAGIGSRLSALKGMIQEAAAQREAASPGPGFQAAADRLSRLTTEADQLRAALHGLADTTRATAGLQERLTALQSNREARLAYAERLAVADPSERRRMGRGYALAVEAGRAGTLQGLGQGRTRQALEALNALGAAKLPELGGERASDVKRRLLGPLAGVDPKDATEEEGLKREMAAAFARAEEAQRKLIEDQRGLQSSYFETATRVNAVFLAGLRAELARAQLSDAEAKAGQTGRALGEMRGDRAGYDLLRQAGVDNDEELTSLQARRADVAALAGSLQADARVSAARQAAMGRLGELPYMDPKTAVGRARETLEGLSDVLTPNQRDAALAEFDKQRRTPAMKAWYATEDQDYAERRAAVSKALQGSLRLALGTTLEREVSGHRSEQVRIAGRLAPAGVDWAGLKGAVGTGGGAEFLRALDRFGSANPFGKFADRLTETEKEFDRLTAAAARLREAVDGAKGPGAAAGAVVGGAALGFSGGGPVPDARNAGPLARGTDTALAVLSPDEFVVNARQARRHRGLLERLNRGEAPVYRADGGPVGDETAADRAARLMAAARHERLRLADVDIVRERTAAEKGARAGANDFARMDTRGYGALVRGESDVVGPPDPAAEAKAAQGLAAAQAAAAAPDRGALARRLRMNGGAHLGMELAGSPRARLGLLRDAIAGEARTARAFGDEPGLARVFGGVVGAARADAEEAFGDSEDGVRSYFASARDRVNARTARSRDAAFRRMFGLGSARGGPTNRTAGTAGLGLEDKVLGLAGLTPPRRFFSGGVVPGVGQSDSVPAALRPGEGVLTPSGMRAAGGAAGLAGLNNGGGTGDSAVLAKALMDSHRRFELMADKLQKFSDAVGRFVPAAHELAEALDKMPREIRHEGDHRHEVRLVGGAEILEELRGLTPKIVGAVRDEMHGVVDDRVPNANQRPPGG